MLRITLPVGSEVNQTEQNQIRIQVPNTKFYVVGEKKTKNSWDIYLLEPQTNRKDILKRDVLTGAFCMFSNVILKTPFPGVGKTSQNIQTIKRFIKKLTKNK